MAFKELDKRPINEVEKTILEKWKKENILKRYKLKSNK